MAKITKACLHMVNIAPKVVRTDAIQSFASQETPIVTLTDSEGISGTGYSYTIGTGGGAIVSLLTQTLLPAVMGEEADAIERIWQKLLFTTHATSVGAITSLALAAIDTALWDLRCKRASLPLYLAAGGAKTSVPVYTSEGGWLHIEKEKLVEDALEMQSRGFRGSKIKIGSACIDDDRARIGAVREAVGAHHEIMVDANQSLSLSKALRIGSMLEVFDVAWFEEPLPADDVGAHAILAQHCRTPVAVGESIYSVSHIKEYLTQGACSIVQVDVARIGGITPWLKAAHLAESFNVAVHPHFLMELHISLVCAVPNAPILEYIPQLEAITVSGMRIEKGHASPSNAPGIGIDWDWDFIHRHQVAVIVQ